MRMERESCEHKDSLFVVLFCQDKTAKKNLLSLVLIMGQGGCYTEKKMA